MAKRIRLALDCTPNTNHSGFYIAAQKGFYDDLGVEVEFLLPDDTGDAPMTSTQKIEAGLADLAIVASESVINSHIQENSFPLVAIATILAKDVSAVVTLQKSSIERPMQLDGKLYASNQLPFEGSIIRQLIINDGGQGDLKMVYPEKLNIWNTLLTGKADAAWIFLPWEGIDAQLKDIDLNIFKFANFDIPYGYNLLLAGHQDFIKKKKIRRFLKATAKGFLFARNNPLEAAALLTKGASHFSVANKALVEQSQVFISQYYLDDNGNWGIMHNKIWSDFVDWLIQQGFLTDSRGEIIHRLDPYLLFSNEILEDY